MYRHPRSAASVPSGPADLAWLYEFRVSFLITSGCTSRSAVSDFVDDFPSLYAIVDAELLTRRGVSLRSSPAISAPPASPSSSIAIRTAHRRDILTRRRNPPRRLRSSDCQLILQRPRRPRRPRRLRRRPRRPGRSLSRRRTPRRRPESHRRRLHPHRRTGTHRRPILRRLHRHRPRLRHRHQANPDPVVGLEGVRRARSLTTKPLVAIGGITRANARSVIDSGADSIAVISALFAPNESPEQLARDFLAHLR